MMRAIVLLSCLLSLLVTSVTAEEVRVLAYNVFLRPGPVGWFDYKDERFAELSEAVRAYDIIGLSEVFDNKKREEWKDILRSTHPYCVEPPHKDNVTNGGLTLFSRYPITFFAKTIYHEKDNWDAFADKGVIFARLEMPGEKFLEIALTHAQAGGDYPHIREKQFEQMQAFIDKHSQGHPLMLLGDFNVDAAGEEYRKMLQFFEQPMDLYPSFKKDPGYTSNGLENPLSGGDDKKRIDYIFFHNPQKHVRLKDCAVNKFAMENPVGKAKFMSDHYAVEATLEWGERAQERLQKVSWPVTVDFSEVTQSSSVGQVTVIDSHNHRYQQSFHAQGNRLVFPDMASGRAILHLDWQGRRVSQVVEVSSKQQTQISLPLGTAKVRYQLPSQVASAKVRISGKFYQQQLGHAGESFSWENIPAGDYRLAIEMEKLVVVHSFQILPGQEKDLTSVIDLQQYLPVEPSSQQEENAKVIVVGSPSGGN